MANESRPLWLFGGATLFGIVLVALVASVVHSNDPAKLETLPQYSRSLSTNEVEHWMKLIASDSSERISKDDARHLVAHLRRLYPFESIRDRLPTILPLDERRPVKMSAATRADLESYETINGRASRTYGDDLRSESIRLLHEEQVRDFIARDGNGRMRTPPPSAIHLALRISEPIPLDQGPVLMSIDRDGKPIDFPDSAPSLREILQSEGFTFSYEKVPEAYRSWAEKNNPMMIPDQTFLIGVHRQAHDQFVFAGSNGYVKSVDAVAGFLPHHLSSRPQIEPWDTRWYASLNRGDSASVQADRVAGDDAVWLLTQMELLSLLVHEEPAAYVTDYLPRMDLIDPERMRPLDDFEKRALDRLHAGEDLLLEGRINEIRMLGSIRASKNCLTCHDVRRGELLGAFTYTLTRAKPMSTRS